MARNEIAAITLCLLLLLGLGLCAPIHNRFISLMNNQVELQVEHFGRVDEYGNVPRHRPRYHHVTNSSPLKESGKSKRDDPDSAELYYNDIM
ncbi:hypothetical protein XENTR_v10010751 [Xenopus tropicalis]|nr:hypothetical protein XENTR_v10010751 [Xenopus tropicalis]